MLYYNDSYFQVNNFKNIIIFNLLTKINLNKLKCNAKLYLSKFINSL